MEFAFNIGNIFHWNDRNLNKFPTDFIQYKYQIYQLYMKNNNIEEIPKWINCMDKLTHLYLDNNNLSVFPDELCQLINLEVLFAPKNIFKSITPMLSKLIRLTQLNLSYNEIKIIPREIFNMSSLWLLDLSHNMIERLPEIFYPDELYYGEIILNNNNLKCVPDNLTRLKNIEYISLHHNKLLYLPALVFRKEAKINVDHNPYLSYMIMNTQANCCGFLKHPLTEILPNIMLTCKSHDIVISPKIKQVLHVEGDAYCPTLKEFALRMVYVWKVSFQKNDIPISLNRQITSGPAALCMQCSRPLFNYFYICLSNDGSKIHLEALFFCSKVCHKIYTQLFEINNGISFRELKYCIK
ncbi:leucine-rich repeat-containing protein 28-like [Daktulosphaira vitifoliae]|uniref:leucine-rich repeat-containing protein 28-like n=1 Tax=Daktulosphaira vitifoliae TaxID=58002 RepID=UPI0021AA897E|nr:leucine-rich repeat-containing protein 28-like [Daktulosphaira vitifoliae]